MPTREVPYHEDLDGDEEREKDVELTRWTSAARFDEIVVWGHEMVVDAGVDGVVKGVEEWIQFASLVCWPFAVAGMWLTWLMAGGGERVR